MRLLVFEKKKQRKLFLVEKKFNYCGVTWTNRFIVIFTVYKFKNVVHELIQASWMFYNVPLL